MSPNPPVRVRATALAFSVLVAPLATAQPLEWPVSEGGNGHFYELLIDSPRKSWLEDHLTSLTREFDGRQGHLATLTSAAENTWVASHLFTPGLPVGSVVYLGGWNDGFLGAANLCDAGPETYCAPLGIWHWITGETWNYAAWAAGEPSEYNQGCGYTAEFALSYLHRWGNLIGFNNLRFEYPLTQHTVAHLVEYDGLAATELPPLDHPVAVATSTWGSIKALYR